MIESEEEWRRAALEKRIAREAAARKIDLPHSAIAALATHAREVLRETSRLHLTTLLDPEEFVERHLGEAFEGAAMLDAGIEGVLLDLGSGNGYPGLPIALARPNLQPVLAEASVKKAKFLRAVLDSTCPRGIVLERQIQRPADIEAVGSIEVLTTRATGGWARILPRLSRSLSESGRILLWAGEEVEQIRRRVIWRRLELVEKREIPGRDQSWIWAFRSVTGQHSAS